MPEEDIGSVGDYGHDGPGTDFIIRTGLKKGQKREDRERMVVEMQLKSVESLPEMPRKVFEKTVELLKDPKYKTGISCKEVAKALEIPEEEANQYFMRRPFTLTLFRYQSQSSPNDAAGRSAVIYNLSDSYKKYLNEKS